MIGLFFGDTDFPNIILNTIKKKIGNFYDNFKKERAKEIFASKNLHENLNKINGEHKGNELVNEVITFIEKDKKRPICSPQS